MWKLLREGLRCYRSVLTISWSVGVGVSVLVFALIALLGSLRDRRDLAGAAVGLPVALLISSMVAGFIVNGTERSERRVRAQLLLPLPIAQVAAARVLLPAVIMLVGLAAAHLVLAAVSALRGGGEARPGHLQLAVMAVQLLFYLQLPLALREVLELRQDRRLAAALASAALVLAVFAVAVWLTLGGAPTVAVTMGGMAALGATIMLFTATLFCRRRQFTR